MAKLSEISTTSLTFDEGAAASTPSANDVVIYAKTDGLVYSKDDAGVETLMSSGSTSSGVPAGTANPGSPATGDLFWRTDLNYLITYDGTRWLCTCEHRQSIPQINNNATTPLSGNSATVPTGARSIYITRLAASSLVVTTNSGSHYWTCKINYKTSPNTENDLTGFTFNTSADSATTHTRHDVTPTAVTLTSTALAYNWIVTATGSPGNIYCHGELVYRFIVT